MEATRRLARFVAALECDALPGAVVERTRLLVLDLLGIGVRARHEAESTPALLAAARALGLDGGGATVIGDGDAWSPPAAALVNGTLAHSLDFDDTHARGSIHASAPVVPAALAAAEFGGAAGVDLVAGIVAGFEVMLRLSIALVPRDHYARGFHPTATCGAFGAAAAASRVLRLPDDGVANAFGIALSEAAGSMQFLENGAWTKRFQVGNAAMNGLVAATLAREGFLGASQPIEGEAGFLHAYAPDARVDRVCEGLGESWETLAIALKPYPSCRYTHAALDGLVALREAHGLEPDEIESVDIGLPEAGWRLVGAEPARKQNPRSVVDGQFSMPFLAAAVLREGRFGWDDYPRQLVDPRTLALCARVSTRVDPRAEAEFPEFMSAAVRLETSRGKLEKFVRIPRGEPENPLSQEEARGKFDSLAAPYLDLERREALAAEVARLEAVPDLGALLALTRP